MPPSDNTQTNDAYGETVRSLLRPFQADFAYLAQDVTEQFYAFISNHKQTAEIIHWLRDERFEWMKKQLAQYLTNIMSNDLTHTAHMEAANEVGVIHALVGVDIRWIVETYAFYQEKAHKLLAERIHDTQTQHLITRVLAHRLLQDIKAQALSSKKIASEVTAAFSRLDQVAMSTEKMTDLIRNALEIIGNLPGGVAVFFTRVDETGVLQIEQSYGEAAEQYHRAMDDGDVPKMSIDSSKPEGNGPSGIAWRTGEILIIDAWLQEKNLDPWKKVGRALGFRSSATVPLLSDDGRTSALLSLYGGWPGYFSTESIRGFLNHLQQVLSHGVQQRVNAPVVPLREQQVYRTLLSERRVIMHYQPIINLRDGKLVKIEGLARLRNHAGGLISPQHFLPAFGRDELVELFNQGMRQICADVEMFSAQGIGAQVAINLPAEGLEDPRYEKAIYNCLNYSGLEPARLQVEILETQDAGDKAYLRYEVVHRLREAGVKIAQDDLGSGHSSLLRLHQYPFDEVKIDQGLVRGALHNPKRVVEFILYLTRLAHAFNIHVTVEGLENTGLIEAAAILGADYGQGYGIARPMSPEQLSLWINNYDYTIDSARPKTAIGAMAGCMLWDLQLATISEQPEFATEFVGARVLIEEFIKANHLQDGKINELLILHHKLVNSERNQPDAAGNIRSELIKELTDYWFREVHT